MEHTEHTAAEKAKEENTQAKQDLKRKQQETQAYSDRMQREADICAGMMGYNPR